MNRRPALPAPARLAGGGTSYGARLVTAMLAATGTATFASPAAAQAPGFGSLLGTEIPFELDRGNNTSVLDRQHPEIEPLGVHAGSFFVYPVVATGVSYTSNVYGEENDPTDDAFLTVEPRVSAQSDWRRHALTVRASGAFKRFVNNPLKNESGYNFAADGKLDIVGDNNLTASMDYGRTYLAQYSGAFPSNSAASVPLDRFRTVVRGTVVLNRLRFIVGADVNDMDFGDTETLDGDLLDQDYRDATVTRFSGRAEYALTPSTAMFLQATYALSDYTNTNGGATDRGGDETRVLAGITFDITRVARAAIGIGYLTRHYSNPIYPDIGALAADVRLDYFASQLTTISLALRRETQDAIVATSPGYVVTEVQLRADHELLRNLLLYAQAGYEHDQFKNITRRDDLATVGVGGNYTPFRNLVLNPDLQYISRKSNGEFFGQQFNEFRAMVRTTFRI